MQPTDFFEVYARGYTLDFWAFGLVLVLSVLLCWGIKETKTVNNSEHGFLPNYRQWKSRALHHGTALAL